MEPERVTYFGVTDSRSRRDTFGIKAKDRTKHVYVIGKTGMGKSTLLENMVIQDIRNGEGLAFIDPHGTSAEKILDYIPKERIDDVMYFAPFDMDNPVAFNVMEDVGYDKRHLVVNGLMAAFKKIWVDVWSSRMEYILTNTLLALLEYPGATMLGVNKMYTDKEFRKKVVENVKDPLVKSFWVEEFATYTDRYTQEATPAIQNKVGQFTGNPLIRNIIGQPKSTFNLREMIDTQKIIICNISKGKVGEVNANLLGSMLITKIYLAAMSRADVTEQVIQKLPNFYFYVDEFQSFANESFVDILSEARKYKLNLTIAHQYIEQMSDEVRAAVFGNVGTMVVFRVGAYDADVLEKEFAPTFYAQDLVNLGFTQIYLKLMIDGVSSTPFSATTLPPIEPPTLSYKDQVIFSSRSRFGKERSDVEAEIARLHAPAPKPIREEREKRVDGRGHDERTRESGRGEKGVRQYVQKQGEEHKRPGAPQMDESRHKEQLAHIASQIRSQTAPAHQNSSKEQVKTQNRQKEGQHGGRGKEGIHRASLRDALASVMEKKEPTLDAGDVQREKGTQEIHKEKTAFAKHGRTAESGPREIPEHELRKLLDVEER